MKNLKKKGFTIVELVIVIAVIAILSAVLIPTFSSLIKKANESSDIQAVRNINLFLASADITDDVDSILDVYDVFEETGYDVESYNPLYKGRSFYYDIAENKILYVDDLTGKTIFPKECEGFTKEGREWLSLGMEITTEEVSAVESGSDDDLTLTYKVSNPYQYAYVSEQLSKSNSWAKNVVIEISEDIDFSGAYVAIDNVPDGSTLTIKGKDKNVVMKNITSNNSLEQNETGRKYISAGLIGTVSKEANVVISDVTFENINVKNTHSGNAALLFGSAEGSSNDGKVTLTNVTIKNSNVIGHRSVGALVGMLYSTVDLNNVVLENVNVKTVAGRSGLLFGFVSMSTLLNNDTVLDEVLDYTNINSTLSIYENEQNSGGIKDYTGEYNAEKEVTSYSLDGNDKEYRTYGFNKDALYCKYNPADPSNYYLFELAK